ncbi:hypothetical protein BKA67DRAFT_536078 [Truncatella angustata]|uniref:15-hydroxyprostaglandin dehydrogenase n=1 Tax=Truncatella angustata TaxID=152316 RepID=A0A9P8UMI5_9PEZI|nr:uncharacterized protein BKA67DRAFT_536078 [Truncatella angustata]KAH6654781.1 hypothetical protein BKA67DRAFT_536078 [Truncatella angustata]KAH8196035.1 hypothetical protein TruAng_009811 [Truncatella angustata]
MSAYNLQGKYAIVTGGGSGINYVTVTLLLEAGCSVMIADLRLRPEAEELLSTYTGAEPGSIKALFHKTDIGNWANITTLWDATLEAFGRIDIVVNGAGIYEPPSSTFWNPPGRSTVAQDDANSEKGVYKTFSVNALGPIRLSQIAIEYWIENRHKGIEGNLFFVISVAAYITSLHTPLYEASKAAIMGFARSLGTLRKLFGIRVAGICPGGVYTPLLQQDYTSDRLTDPRMYLQPEQCAEVCLDILQKPQYGDGNIVEVVLVGTVEDSRVNVREVPFERVYLNEGMEGVPDLFAGAEEALIEALKVKGMGGPEPLIK